MSLSLCVFESLLGTVPCMVVSRKAAEHRKDAKKTYSISFPFSPGKSIWRCTHKGALPFDISRS